MISTLCIAVLCSHAIFYVVNGDLVELDNNEVIKDPYKSTEQSDQSNENRIDLNKPAKEDGNCWLTLNAKDHFTNMDALDKIDADIRDRFQQAIGGDNFDKEMLEMLIKSRGISDRAIQQDGGQSKIPAGLNLGGHCMMRMQNSMLFFHRLKLRNDTHFHVNYIHNDLLNMQLESRISLNDLHLIGTYERSMTDKNPSILYYTPTFGQIEFLLKDVQYKMEGRYRLVQERLFIELVISAIKVDDILMSYSNKTTKSPSISLHRRNIEQFLERLKVDLDKWLRDYFNDYLLYIDLAGPATNAKFQEYDKNKALTLNEYVDTALSLMKRRLQKLKATAVKLPMFSIFSTNGVELKLKNGVLHGLDSMYRRSVATGIRVKGENIRKTDVIIGFSNLKAVYNYDAVLTTGVPPLNGQLILSADELTSLMSIKLVKDSETVDINFEFMQQMKPESLALEGPANTMIANFKHLLELHIIAIMSNSMIYQIKLLSSLTKCQPYFVAHIDPEDLKYRNSIKEAYENETLHDESNRLIIFKNNEDNKSNEISKEDLKETSDTGSVIENVTESLSENEEDLTTENGEDSSSENSDDETKVVTSNADFILNKQDSIQNGVAS